MLFPHGILDYNNFNHSDSSNILLSLISTRKIASYGFLFPHKGIIQLIDAINILRKRNFLVELNLITSIYNDNDLSFYDEVSKHIDTLGLSSLVTLNTQYLSDQESLDLLSINDLIVFPYQDTNESSSAAVRHGLASGKPVLVTPLEIFNDVSTVVNFSSGFSPIEIANSILKWYKSKDLKEEEIARKKRFNLIQERSFYNLGKRFSSIAKGLYINSFC